MSEIIHFQPTTKSLTIHSENRQMNLLMSLQLLKHVVRGIDLKEVAVNCIHAQIISLAMESIRVVTEQIGTQHN